MPDQDSLNQNVVQDVPVHPNEIYASEIQQERIRNLISQTSPDNQIEELEWRIKGYRKDRYSDTGWSKIVKGGDSVDVPDELVNDFVSYISSILNENTRFTNLSSDEINRIMAKSINWLRDYLQVHGRRDFDLNYNQMTKMGDIICNQLFMILKRAQNGMESRRIFRALSLNENINAGMQQHNKSSVIDALKFWKP